VERELREFVRSRLNPQAGDEAIELGAGNSAYLPSLASQFGYRVSGLDYSALGVELARRNLAAAGVNGQIRRADLFDPPVDWIDKFDAVFTFGVVEHFDDTAAVIRACAKYLSPSGSMFTLIPNMSGLPGAATRFLSMDLYHRHVSMTPVELAVAHRRAGLAVEVAAYVGGINMWVANPAASPSRARRTLFLPALALTRLMWALQDRGLSLRPNRTTSPWVVVVARK
jgi:2-polyprenyl-6-hydroxyphenyl methylase/3-demethylubiquinone-9 3-methyltransferase